MLRLQPGVPERQRAAAALPAGPREGPLPHLPHLRQGLQESHAPEGRNPQEGAGRENIMEEEETMRKG